MLCFRCGSPIEDDPGQCNNCGQELSDAPTENPEDFADIQRRLRESSPNLGHDATFRVGESVAGRYEICDLIGGGALGVVYKATDTESGDSVAVKVVASDFLPDNRSREKFVSVVERAREIDRENAVRVFDVGIDGDRVYVVSQFLEGLSLRKIIELRRSKEQRFSIEEVMPIYTQLCAAVGSGKNALVHGGLKPANVIILRDLLVVTDYYLLEAVSAGPFMAAQRGMGQDAVRFAASEIQNREPFDRRSDVFAIAAIVVELLSGEAWDGGEVVLSELDGEIEPEVDDVLNRALEDEASERFADAAELASALELAFAGLPPQPVAGGGEVREISGVYVESEGDVPVAAPSSTISEPAEPAEPDGTESLVDAEEAPTKPFSGATDSPAVSPPIPERGHSQITHQLDLTDVEFEAEEQAWFERDPILDEDTDRFTELAAGDASETSAGAEDDGSSAENTRRYAPAELEQVLDDNEDDTPLLGNRDHSVSGELRHMLAKGELAAPPLPAPEGDANDSQEREAHARNALEAFDSELPAAPETAEATETTQRVGPLEDVVSGNTNVAPEVLHEDAVPPPMDATVVAAPAEGQPAGEKSFLGFMGAMAILGVLLGFGFWFFWGQEKLEQRERHAGRTVTAKPPAVRLTSARLANEAVTKSSSPTTTRLAEVDSGLSVDMKAPTNAAKRATLVSSKPPADRKTVTTAEKTVAKPEPIAAKKNAQASPIKEVAAPSAKLAPKPSPKSSASTSSSGAAKKVAKPKKSAASPSVVAPSKGAKECYAAMAFVKASSGDGYCIDRFESPGRGRKPRLVSFAAAKKGCMGRGLRLCTAREWTRGCGGRFPYGRTYDADRCNTTSGATLPAGSKKRCRSRWGAYDMSGNAAEWVAEGVAMGGSARSDAGHASCMSRAGAAKMTGYRCCSEPRWD